MKDLVKKLARDTTGIVWVAMGILTAMAVASYYKGDPSLNSFGGQGTVRNLVGVVGSYYADLVLQLFGVSAVLISLSCLGKGYGCFRKGKMFPHPSKFISLLVLMGGLSTLLETAIVPYLNSKFMIPVSGMIGFGIRHQLLGLLSTSGLIIVACVLMLISTMFLLEKSLFEILRPLFSQASIKPILIAGQWFWKIIFRLSKTLSDRKIQFKHLEDSNTQSKMPERVPEKFLAKEDQEEFRIASKKATESVEKRILHRMRENIQKMSQVENWNLPSLDLMADPPKLAAKVDDREYRMKAARLVDKLQQFGVHGTVQEIHPGPAVTLFEFKPNADVKISRITELADDLALALSSESIRIIAPIPGRDVVGIETSNAERSTVYLKDSLKSPDFWQEECRLPLSLGRQADGAIRIVDLRKMPHLLVAGSTGSGKSVFTVSSVLGLLFRHSPKTLRLMLIDPKQVDLAIFSGVPHLIMPPIRETSKAVLALKWAVKEMDKRYRSMAKFGARGLELFNESVLKMSDDELKPHIQFNAQSDMESKSQSYYFKPLPYIVIVVEEFGDLMAVDKGNVETLVVRLAQMARACGIHLILAMQSPRKDVVTGLIKTNIPGRISFKVASKTDSRIILDESGAERLLTRGDMLFLSPGVAKPARHHGPWISEEEINKIIEHWKGQGEPVYDSQAMGTLDQQMGSDGESMGVSGLDINDSELDERYDEILSYVSTLKEVSASHLQRRFRLGYPRAARLVEILESEGVVGPASGSKPRQVLVKNYDSSPAQS